MISFLVLIAHADANDQPFTFPLRLEAFLGSKAGHTYYKLIPQSL